MKRIALLLLLAAPVAICAAQTTTPAKSASTAAKKPGTTAASSAIKLPPGVPPARGIVKTAFALRYQDIKLGTGKEAEPGKLYKVHYTGWLASDGTKFDSSYDHRAPLLDKDGKPQKDAEGKPVLGDPQPLTFPQGRGRLIPGWDQGFGGMKVGGKRRLFIPYQLAYGALGRPPKIPAKADLIFDVELIDVTDMPQQPGPGMPGIRPMTPTPGGTPGAAPKPLTPANPASPSTAPATPPASTPTAPPTAPSTPTTPTPATTPAPQKPANPAQPN
jgi:peptidylprolyl isomerase